MEEFAQELRDMGYQEVRLVDTAEEVFGSRRRAAMMMPVSYTHLDVYKRQVYFHIISHSSLTFI